MTSIERDIKDMLARGAEYDTIRDMLDKMEKEQQEKENAKKAERLAKTKETLVDAIIGYTEALGLEVQADDRDFLMQLINGAEASLTKPSYRPNLLGSMLSPKISHKISGPIILSTDSELDEDVLRKFIKREIE